MNFKLNEEFLYIKKGDNLHIVSIYPDHDEIYKFSGKVVPLLEICFREKYILLITELENITNTSIDEKDWSEVQRFLISKKIFV